MKLSSQEDDRLTAVELRQAEMPENHREESDRVNAYEVVDMFIVSVNLINREREALFRTLERRLSL